MAFLNNKSLPILTENENLIEEVRKTIIDINALESNFNLTSDFDMIEYYSLRLKAEQAKHSYLIKKIKGKKSVIMALSK